MRNGILSLFVMTALAFGSGFVGCGDDNSGTTPNPDVGKAGSGGSAGSGGGGAGGGMTGADAAAGAGGGDAGPSAECFSGTPVSNEDFINSCPDPAIQTDVYNKPNVILPGGLHVGDKLPDLQ